MGTTLVVPAVVLDGLGDVLLEDAERLLGDLFLGEVVGDDLLDELGNVLVSLGEVLIEFVANHRSKLLPLLDGLSLLNR